MSHFRRRELLIAAATTAAPFQLARSQAPAAPLRVLAHRVHKTVAVGTPATDVTASFTATHGVPVEWTTFDTGPLQERLMREAALAESTFDVGFILNTQASPRIAGLFEPLDAYLAKDPLEDSADVFPGLLKGFTLGGRLLAMPVRHASSGMHWNADILAERGFSKPPATMEELVLMAKACTYRRADGTPCVGLVMPGVTYPNVIDIARAWDGDFITPNFKILADQQPMLNAIHLLRDLFQTGAFPRNFSSLASEDVNTLMQQGRGAISLVSMGRNRVYNDPQKSKFPGRIMTGAVPIAASLRSRYPVAPAKVEFWGLVIPKNSKRKDLAWRFIKAMLTKDATLQMALSGNGPVRASTYDDAGFRATVPYADAERSVLRVARVPLPAFDEATRAGDIFKEEAEAAVLGTKTPEAAMASVVQRVRPLLPV